MGLKGVSIQHTQGCGDLILSGPHQQIWKREVGSPGRVDIFRNMRILACVLRLSWYTTTIRDETVGGPVAVLATISNIYTGCGVLLLQLRSRPPISSSCFMNNMSTLRGCYSFMLL